MCSTFLQESYQSQREATWTTDPIWSTMLHVNRLITWPFMSNVLVDKKAKVTDQTVQRWGVLQVLLQLRLTYCLFTRCIICYYTSVKLQTYFKISIKVILTPSTFCVVGQAYYLSFTIYHDSSNVVNYKHKLSSLSNLLSIYHKTL